MKRGRILFLLSFLGARCLEFSVAGAVPVLPQSVWLEQPSGERILARAVGDERAFRWVTPDGRVLRPLPEGGWVYWTELGPGRSPPKTPRPTPTAYPLPCPGGASLFGSGSTGSAPPVEGEVPVLVVAVEFSDRQSSVTLDDVADMIGGDHEGALSHYYTEVSYGSLDLVPAVPQQSWYTSSRTMVHYGEDSSPGVDNANGYICELAREALELADGEVDFASFDANGNGRLDAGEVHIIIVHAGPDQANNPSHPEYIWSHRWWIWGSPYGMPDTYLDGVLVSEPNLQGEETSPGYVMVSEADPLGVIAHELFHSFGAPDLYDPNDQNTYIVGGWCLMGRGVWNGTPAGALPSQPCGYLKMDVNADPSDGLRGWITPGELVSPGHYALNYLEGSCSGRLYLIRIPGDNEYFALENRLKVGYDSALPGQGMLIFHIDEDMPNFNQDWDPRFPRVSLEDPGGDSRKRTAAFSLESGHTDFTPETDPNTASNDGAPTGISITSVSSSGDEMTFVYGTPEPVPSTTRIASCYPNPFGVSCSLVLHVGQNAAGTGGRVGTVVDVYDIVGRKMARLWEGLLPRGSHTITWDGTDLRGRRAPPGTYVALAKVGGTLHGRRVVLIPPDDENP